MTTTHFRHVLGLLFVSTLFSCPVASHAAGPNKFLNSLFDRNAVEAEPNKEYPLQATNGSLLILVTSFDGQNGRQNANTLVYELRSKYKLKAYVYQKTFTNDIRQDPEVQRNLSGWRSNYQTKGTSYQYSVLVGDFHSDEDKDFKKTLQKIKECQPESMRNMQGIGRVAGYSKPFTFAFGIPNPLLPPKLLPGEVDPFVEELNEGNPVSLLNCPGQYTLRIATFKGETGMARYDDSDKLDDKNNSKKKKTELEYAALAAHKLCQSLRKRGFEAYEFHDRYASIVTVGSFNDIGYKLPNGLIETPKPILDLMSQFQGKRVNHGDANRISYQPVIIDHIECDVQPQLYVVPRRPSKR